LYTTYDKDLDPVTFFWGKDGKQDYEEQYDRRQITIENNRSVDIRLEYRSKKENPDRTSKITADKARIVQLDCAVLEVSPPLKMDKEITNMLGNFPTMFDPPMYMSSADLLLGEATGDKRTTRERIGILIEKLVSGGRAKMLMHPTLQLAEGQTHKFETAGNFLQVTPRIVKDGYIDMWLEVTFNSKFIQDHRIQNPVVSRRTSSNSVRNKSGEILIIGSAVQIEEG
ncbi:unnamed protein product, partial [marine sediment metagenome]